VERPLLRHLKPQLLTDLTVPVPADIASDAPMPSGMPDALPVNIQWDPEKQDKGGNARHGAVRIDVADTLDPGVGVERQQKSEGGCGEVVRKMWGKGLSNTCI
jgi:hypothetical protein